MPRPKRPDTEPVTLTLSAECAHLLRSRAAQLKRPMGAICEELVMQGLKAKPARVAAATEAPADKPTKPATAPKPPAAPKEGKPKAPGDAELFQRLDAHIKAGRIGQGAAMRGIAPEISPTNYRASWGKTGHVPAKYVEAARALVERLDAEAGSSEPAAPEPGY